MAIDMKSQKLTLQEVSVVSLDAPKVIDLKYQLRRLIKVLSESDTCVTRLYPDLPAARCPQRYIEGVPRSEICARCWEDATNTLWR